MDFSFKIYLVAMFTTFIVSIFIITFCKYTKEVRGTPSVVASSSVHVNVYSARGGGGDEIQRQIQDLKLGSRTFKLKVPSVSTGDVRGTPYIVASSSVHVNVYEPTGAANSSEDQRQIQDLKLTNSAFKAPSVSTGDGSKVVHDGSKGSGSGEQKQIRDLNLTHSFFKVTSISIGLDGKKVVHDGSKLDGTAKDVVGVSVNSGGPGGVCANVGGGGNDNDDGVGSGAGGGIGGRSDTNSS